MWKVSKLKIFNLMTVWVFLSYDQYLSRAHLKRGFNILNLSPNTSIEVYIWSRHNPKDPELLNSSQYMSERFNPKAKTKLLIHGYLDVGDTDWILKMKDEYLSKDNYNVLSLDYREVANANYFTAVKFLENVGLNGVDLLKGLRRKDDVVNGSLDLGTLHIIGFSLGAQVAGIIGHSLNGQVERITGLDPARPVFEEHPLHLKLDASDAHNVDVIHTAGYYISIPYAIGDVDFFPNGGHASQPGCEEEAVFLLCSHERSHELYTGTIKSGEKYKSVQCDSWKKYQKNNCSSNPINWMGDGVDFQKKGSFYLKTEGT